MTFEEPPHKPVDVYCVISVARECKTDKYDIVSMVALPERMAKELSGLCTQKGRAEAEISRDANTRLRKKYPKGKPKLFVERSRYEREQLELEYTLLSERVSPLNSRINSMIKGMPREKIYPPTGRLRLGEILNRAEVSEYPKVPLHPFCSTK